MNYKIKNLSYYIIAIVLALAIIGVFMVKDASSVWAKYLYDDEFYFFKRQIIFLVIGIVVFCIGYFVNATLLYRFSKLMLYISLALLGLVLIPGVGVVKNGSRSWFGIGSFGFQPSELFKIVFLIYASRFLAENYEKTMSLKTFLPLFFYAGLGFVLTMLEPDFGTALVTMMGLAMLIFISKLKVRYFVAMGGLCVVGFVVLIATEPYRFLRITAFLNPYDDPLGAGFQIIQSLYAIGPSGLTGLGFNGSLQKHFYLPEPQTDFIFAIIIEEFGIIGGFIILLLYGTLFYLCYKYALKSTSVFNCYLKLSLTNVIMMQTLINLCVVVGLLPVTGITLPLISYGGSSMLITLFAFGIIASKGDLNENSIISRHHRWSHFTFTKDSK